jgi:hypothetical protein
MKKNKEIIKKQLEGKLFNMLYPLEEYCYYVYFQFYEDEPDKPRLFQAIYTGELKEFEGTTNYVIDNHFREYVENVAKLNFIGYLISGALCVAKYIPGTIPTILAASFNDPVSRISQVTIDNMFTISGSPIRITPNCVVRFLDSLYSDELETLIEEDDGQS